MKLKPYDPCEFGTYNIDFSIQDVLKAVIEYLGLSEEDGIRISKIENAPVWVIYDEISGKAIAFVHDSEDRYFLTEDIFLMVKDTVQTRYQSEVTI